jgi:hypothetical protein
MLDVNKTKNWDKNNLIMTTKIYHFFNSKINIKLMF